MKIKKLLKILREAVLILLVLIIASGIGYQCSKTPEQREKDGMLLWDSAGQESNKEKQLRTSIVDYFYMDLGQAIKLSDKIVRGKGNRNQSVGNNSGYRNCFCNFIFCWKKSL